MLNEKHLFNEKRLVASKLQRALSVLIGIITISYDQKKRTAIPTREIFHRGTARRKHRYKSFFEKKSKSKDSKPTLLQ